ncbi:MAG: glycosyltransferase family 4 protein [Candidatus Zixiibacteriota bacterium]
MKRVLFVTYAFPPMAAVGGRRIVDFCKYLPEYGWEPVVLTVKGGSNTAWDDTQLDKVAHVKVYRSPIYLPMLPKNGRRPGPKRQYTGAQAEIPSAAVPTQASAIRSMRRAVGSLLRIPDEINFWIPLGLAAGIRAVRKEKVAAVVSSSPPVSGHVLASLLARVRGCPHVVDFRDLWTLNHTYAYRQHTPTSKRVDAALERWVLRKAARIVTASPGFEDQLRLHLSGSLADRLVTITNGFDYDEIDLNREFVPRDSSRMRIVYTGSLYSDFNPVFFLECLAEWMKRSAIDPGTIQVDFYGNCEYDYSDFLAGLGLARTVTFHGFVSHTALPAIVEQADYQLLLLSFKPQHAPVIPAKLFEYLAAPARILALTPRGTTADLIARYEAGEVLSEPDREKMSGIFDRMYRDWRESARRPKKYRYIREIDRKFLAERFAGELDRVTASRLGPGVAAE